MRRLLILLTAVGFVALSVGPVAAAPGTSSGTEVMIAVPYPLAVDGELDLVVFTGAPASTIDVPFLCFLEPGTFEVRPLAIQDQSGGQHGLARGIITNLPVTPGTRLSGMGFLRECEVGGVTYRVYVGVTE
jgi:hypothetical protein